MFPKRAIVTNVIDGLGYKENDYKYIGKAFNHVITIVDYMYGDLYLTNFYIPEFKNELNDYCYHGFLIVSSNNIEFV